MLGGYGAFGSRICRLLTRMDDVAILIVGRDARQAEALAQELKANHAALDIAAPADIGPVAALAEAAEHVDEAGRLRFRRRFRIE